MTQPHSQPHTHSKGKGTRLAKTLSSAPEGLEKTPEPLAPGVTLDKAQKVQDLLTGEALNWCMKLNPSVQQQVGKNLLCLHLGCKRDLQPPLTVTMTLTDTTRTGDAVAEVTH